MVNISTHENTYNEIIKACDDFTLPLRPSIMDYLYKRVKYLSESNSEYLPSLASLKIFRIFRNFLSSKERDLRIIALKLCRYIASSELAFETLKQSNIEHFIIRSFESEGKGTERVEACKLIRKWLEISPKNFTKGLCNSLIALSEAENDEFKEFGIEALRLLSSSNLLLVTWSGGLKVLINTISDIKCSQALSENIIFTLSYLLNEAHTRVYLKNGREITRILSIFTEHESGLKENELETSIKLSKKVIVLMSRSWAGLIFLTAGGLKEIITNLRHPIKPIIKEGILDTLFDMLNIPVESSAKSYNLLNNYLAMLIKALLHCDLYPALTYLAIDKNTRISQRARKILKIITKAASDLLPESPQLSLNLLSGSAGKTAELVADIASSARILPENADKNFLREACEYISTEIFAGITPPNLVLSDIYKQHFLNGIDDNQYFNLIVRSQVSKEVVKWDWDTIFEIISGPISQQSRFSHPQSQKFLKNIIGYFMPSKGLFASLKWESCNFIKAQVGSMLISLLVTQEDGINLLTTTYSESFFVVRKSYMGEFSDAIDEEIKADETKQDSPSRIFTSDKIKYYMAREYFKWLGIFFNNRHGKKLLKTYGIFPKLLKLASIEHLGPIILSVFDFKDATITQNFLGLVLQSKSKFARLKAMEHIRSLFRAGIFDLSWTVCWIVNQLHSQDSDTVNSALVILDEITQYKENLKSLIELGPQKLLKLGEEGKKCLIRFLSSSAGVNYLFQLDFINTEIEVWHRSTNKEYARIIEEKIEFGLSAPKKNYSLTLTTPRVFQHSERFQISWISKLPISVQLSTQNQKFKGLVIDTVVELEKEDVLITAFLDGHSIRLADGISAGLMLGLFNIDSKGNKVNDFVGVKCQKDAKNLVKGASGHFIEYEGVVFSFREELEDFVLKSVGFKIQVLPKGMPPMQIPRHLFGELGKTPQGIEKLKEVKYLEEYMRRLSENLPIIEKRACLWALGHTGASNAGASYLSKIRAIEVMVDVAEKSPVLSLRGTASQVLSLVARSSVGRAELSKHLWISAQPLSASIAVPIRAESIFWIENNFENFPYKEKCKEVENILDEMQMSEMEKEILHHICMLGSVIKKTESEQFLRNLRSNSPMVFQNLNLFHAVMITLAGYSFKLSIRRGIHKIFERIHRIECLDDLDGYRYIS